LPLKQKHKMSFYDWFINI